MILVKLHEGLSNQMFQYAAARRLAAVHSTSVRIDTSWYDHIPDGATPRTYELHRLQITGTKASSWETIGTDGVRKTSLALLPVALYRKARPRYRFVGERGLRFDPAVLHLPDNVCLFGYWQSEKYFADASEIIRREFQFRDLPSPDNEKVALEMADSESVAVHVRRGDYVSSPHAAANQGFAGADYYRRAVDVIRERVADPHFFVFSDDLDWARENLPVGPDARFVDHNRGDHSHEDLRLMSLARHNVIANSSFSWWGAWLNRNEAKVVVAPERWTANPALDHRDVLPSDWITV
jgi:hypothetical protein